MLCHKPISFPKIKNNTRRIKLRLFLIFFLRYYFFCFPPLLLPLDPYRTNGVSDFFFENLKANIQKKKNHLHLHRFSGKKYYLFDPQNLARFNSSYCRYRFHCIHNLFPVNSQFILSNLSNNSTPNGGLWRRFPRK